MVGVLGENNMSNGATVLAEWKKKKLSAYDKLIEKNWIKVFGTKIEQRSVRLRDDGKYEETRGFSLDGNWVFVNIKSAAIAGEKCYKYHEYYFGKMGIIPSPCFDCYKVVVKPRTVVELFKLHELQKKLNIPCKAGYEERPYVHRLYGGYFYCAGKENGRECLDLLRQTISCVGDGIEVLLKRGCTEFEMKVGPSDTWSMQPGQEQLEQEFESRYVEINPETREQPEDLVTHIKLKWIHYAAKAKPPDLTYKELTGGKPLVPEAHYKRWGDAE